MNLRPAALAAIAVFTCASVQAAGSLLGPNRKLWTQIKNNTNQTLDLKVVDQAITVGNYYVGGPAAKNPRLVKGVVKGKTADVELGSLAPGETISLYFDTTGTKFASHFAIEANNEPLIDVGLSFNKLGSNFGTPSVTFHNYAKDKVNYTVDPASLMVTGSTWLTISSVD